jgi:hypothetical protein
MWHAAHDRGRYACVNEGGVVAAAARPRGRDTPAPPAVMRLAGRPTSSQIDPIRPYAKFLTTSLR